MEGWTRNRGAGLVEVLIGILIVAIAAIGTLSYFSSGLGGINREGNRRAAMERARERLELLLETNINNVVGGIVPANSQGQFWLDCRGGVPCVAFAARGTEPVAVGGLPNQMETTVQQLDEPTSGTTGLDLVQISVKVWFTQNGADDDYNRVFLSTLRAL